MVRIRRFGGDAAKSIWRGVSTRWGNIWEEFEELYEMLKSGSELELYFDVKKKGGNLSYRPIIYGGE